MSQGSREEQICLAAGRDSAVGRGAQASPSAENPLPGAAGFGDMFWLWISASCRAPAGPAALCGGLELDEGLAGQG